MRSVAPHVPESASRRLERTVKLRDLRFPLGLAGDVLPALALPPIGLQLLLELGDAPQNVVGRGGRRARRRSGAGVGCTDGARVFGLVPLGIVIGVGRGDFPQAPAFDDEE